MNRRAVFVLWLMVGGIIIAASFGVGREKDPAARRVVPGLTEDGSILLHNQWKIRPVGMQVELGDFPVHAELHPSGEWLAVLHAGHGTHEIIVLELKGVRPRIVSRTAVDQTWYGFCFDAAGKSLYVSGGEYEVVHRFDFDKGYLFNPRTLTVAAQTEKFIPGGMALDATAKSLVVCGTFGDALVRVPLDQPGERVRIPLIAKAEGTKASEAYPYTCLLDKSRERMFVSLWNRAAVAVLDLSNNRIVAEWKTEQHPTEMVQSPDGKRLYVACSNSTRVSVLDAASGEALQTLTAALYPKAENGNTPNSLAL